MLIHETIERFTEQLAAKSPTPGGGGAAALSGALAAALCSMAGNFTVGKKKYAQHDEALRANLAASESLRRSLLELIDGDARAFTPLSEAYSLPKDSPERPAKLEAATVGACSAPLDVMRQCARVLGLLDELFDKGSKMLISDIGCGAVLCRAAMESAAMNIITNTSTLTDNPEAQAIESEAHELLSRYVPKAQEISQKVIAVMKEGKR